MTGQADTTSGWAVLRGGDGPGAMARRTGTRMAHKE